MPENAGPKTHGGAGNRAKGTYQDRDKPSQIRFSNISAGKGEVRAGGAPALRAGAFRAAPGAVALGGESRGVGAAGGCAGRAVRALGGLRRELFAPAAVKREVVPASEKSCEMGVFYYYRVAAENDSMVVKRGGGCFGVGDAAQNRVQVTVALEISL